ncbi:hypothetical protein GE061_001609 [Apolygus lucorum]|uniref:Uncharacterized protein n=1 Tax=Apolygus lucorum TaxID=248454 RepID=A0A6A4K932_APOLU|nr:hypothetical protein GE061_001609 [Apolygus lucorum]
MTFFSTLIFCAVLACNHAATNKILPIQFKRMDSPLTSMLQENVHPNVVTAVLNDETKNNSSFPLTYNFMNNEYYTEIYLGRPGQKFLVSFDTTWGDSWVPSSSCSTWSIACKMRNKYNEKKSSSSIKTPFNFRVSLGSSDLAGEIFYDLLNLNGINVTGQMFAATTEIPWIFVFSSFDGVFGMSLSYYNKIIPVMWNLKKQKIIDQMVFSFYFHKDGGSMVLGGVDPAHYKGNFTYLEVVKSDPPQWKLQVDSISLTGSKNVTINVCKSGCKAIMSTGGSQINGPSKEIAIIHKFIKAKALAGGRYLVSCSEVPKLPNITISFGNTPYVLQGQDYIEEVKIRWIGPKCLSLFTNNYDDKDDLWYLGGAFMSRYYTTFDMSNGRIGFATAK